MLPKKLMGKYLLKRFNEPDRIVDVPIPKAMIEMARAECQTHDKTDDTEWFLGCLLSYMAPIKPLEVSEGVWEMSHLATLTVVTD